MACRDYEMTNVGGFEFFFTLHNLCLGLFENRLILKPVNTLKETYKSYGSCRVRLLESIIHRVFEALGYKGCKSSHKLNIIKTYSLLFVRQ